MEPCRPWPLEGGSVAPLGRISMIARDHWWEARLSGRMRSRLVLTRRLTQVLIWYRRSGKNRALTRGVIGNRKGQEVAIRVRLVVPISMRRKVWKISRKAWPVSQAQEVWRRPTKILGNWILAASRDWKTGKLWTKTIKSCSRSGARRCSCQISPAERNLWAIFTWRRTRLGRITWPLAVS